MKVWITREYGKKGRIVITTKKPRKVKRLFYAGESAIVLIFYTEFRQLFGFTPRKGSRKQMNLTLTEIK